MIPTTAEILAALPWIVFAMLVPVLLRKSITIDAYAPPAHDASPLVSVIVPARNEAENITMCLRTLLSTRYPNWEIIVVDDSSVDGTADIVRAIAASEEKVTLIEGAPLPTDWMGKSWACWQGYKAARGDVLLFTDADTRHNSRLLGHSVAALQKENADLLTLLPRQIMQGFWERVILPQVFVAIMIRFHDVTRIAKARQPRDAIANGQFLMFTRTSYDAIGGHEAVRRNVVEDLRLAQIMVEHKRMVFAAHAEDMMETRMYRSLGGIIEGWSKNLALGSRQAAPVWLRPLAPWLLGLLGILFWVVPPVVFIASFFTPVPEFAKGWAFSASLVSLLFWMSAHLRFRIPMLHAMLYPLGALVTSMIFFRSAMRGERVAWRGRDYPPVKPGPAA